jgi:cell division protein FtsB
MSMNDEDYSHLRVRFVQVGVPDKAATKKEGRPVFRDEEFAEIYWAGDRSKGGNLFPALQPMWHRGGRYVTPAEMWHREYQQFKAGNTEAIIGTPLDELPFLTQAKRAELKALNIHTAEALAQLDGTFLQRLGMGGRALKDQAQAYIDHAKETALETRLAAENANLKDQMEAMQEQIAQLMSGATAPAPQTQEEPSRFEDWPDDELKKYIKETTGSAPRGVPAHATLVRMAQDATSEAQAA